MENASTETMMYTSRFGNYKTMLNIGGSKAEGIHLYLFCFDEEYNMYEPYGDLTVRIGDKPLPDYHAYVDTNNMPEAPGFISKYGLGKPTGDIARSGFCIYPLYKFDKDKLAEYCPEGVSLYEGGKK